MAERSKETMMTDTPEQEQLRQKAFEWFWSQHLPDGTLNDFVAMLANYGEVCREQGRREENEAKGPLCDNCGKPALDHRCWAHSSDDTYHPSEARARLPSAPTETEK